MSAPTISLSSTVTMNTIIDTAKKQVKYTLYSDGFAFENWKDWVDDKVNKPTAT